MYMYICMYMYVCLCGMQGSMLYQVYARILRVPKSVAELRRHWCRITFKGIDKNIHRAINVAFSSFAVYV